jgi:hypothetical protein
MPIAGTRYLAVIGMLLGSNMASWHPARNVITFFHVIESNQPLLEISSGMPIGHRNTLAACQLLLKIF